MSINQSAKIESILKEQRYFGRGILIGKTPSTNKAVIAYFISGRSQNSQNRIFIEESEKLIIKPFDTTKEQDYSLIVYSPMRKIKNFWIVTNGDQTDTIYNYIHEGKQFEDALSMRTFEPDVPNFTPRISSILDLRAEDFTYKMSILKSGDTLGIVCNRQFFNYQAINGVGHFIHTYSGDGNPLPSFVGEPKRVEIIDDIDRFTENIWQNLDNAYKIALAVYYINLQTQEKESRILNIHC